MKGDFPAAAMVFRACVSSIGAEAVARDVESDALFPESDSGDATLSRVD